MIHGKILYFILFILAGFQLAAQGTGDVNNDNRIDIVDALMVAQYYVGLNPGGFIAARADFNNDGQVNIVDALMIAQVYVGLITPPPTPAITPTPRSSATSTGSADFSFIIGADISWVQENEDNGQRYYDNGVQKDILRILTEHKFNWIRLRLFHNPAASGGYSSRGYCGLDKTIIFAKRIKAAGLKFLLDFHYSDNWADPGKQVKPSAWASFNFTQLEQAVYDYTKDVITQCRNQGVLPDMVQIGNEINNGFMLPDGSPDNWTNFGRLLKAGVKGAKDADSSVAIMLHSATGGDNSVTRWFMDNAISQGVQFDVIGLSCYPEWHGPPADWQANMTDLAQRYGKRIVIAEYSEYKQEANQIVFNLPGKKGLGTFIWEPTKWHETIFDAGGNTNSRIDLYVELGNQFGL